MSISTFAVPLVILFILAYGLVKRVNIYTLFLEGCAEGLKTVVSIIAPLVAIFVAIGMFRESGGLNLITTLAKPITNLFGFPEELLPFAALRPISGSGSLALATDLFKQYGTDSFAGRCASVLMGSTETTLYAIAVYFGAIGIKNTKYTLKAALLADLFGMIVSVMVCRFFFR